MDLKALTQLASLMEEEDDLVVSIDRIEKRIDKLSRDIQRIENGEMVRDKVYGGEGGKQGFVIEGVPSAEYHRKKIQMESDLNTLEQRKDLLTERHRMVNEQKVIATQYINSIDDSEVRRIAEMRCIEGMTWTEVATCMGRDEAYEAYKKRFYRYLQEH